MTNLPYDSATTKLLSNALLGTGGFNSFAVYAALVTSTYTYSAAHDFYDDLTGVISGNVELTSETVSAAFYDSADIVFPTPASGSTYTQVIFYMHTGVDATADLLARFDTDSNGAISEAGNDEDITLTINAGGIFSLPVTTFFTTSANAILNKGLLNTGGFVNTDIYAALIPAYSHNAAHEHLDDLGVTRAGSVQLGSETIGSVAAGVYDAADPTLPSVTDSVTYVHMILYFHTGSDATADLLIRFPLASSVVGNGNDVNHSFASGGIFNI